MNDLSNDPVVRDILDEAAGGSAADRLELTVAAGGKIEIAGCELPAPTAAVIALLEVIESPFVTGAETGVNPLDIFRALYLIAKREQAALPVLRINRERLALGKLPPPNDAAMTLVHGELLRKLSEAEARFDADVLAYGDTIGRFDPARAAREIGLYVSMASGFDMLPDVGGDKKKDTTT